MRVDGALHTMTYIRSEQYGYLSSRITWRVGALSFDERSKETRFIHFDEVVWG